MVIRSINLTLPDHCSCLRRKSSTLPVLTASARLRDRIAAAAILSLAAFADAMIHAGLAGMKMTTGLVVSPYNAVALTFFPHKAISRDLELSSALIHAFHFMENIFVSAVAPFICLLRPERTLEFVSQRLGLQEDLQRWRTQLLKIEVPFSNGHVARIRQLEQQEVQLQRTVHDLKQQTTVLQGAAEGFKQEKDRLDTIIAGQALEVKNKQELEQQVSALSAEKTQRENQLHVQAEEIERLKQEKAALEAKVNGQAERLSSQQTLEEAFHCLEKEHEEQAQRLAQTEQEVVELKEQAEMAFQAGYEKSCQEISRLFR